MGTAAIMRKGQFERIKPLNWPFIVCLRPPVPEGLPGTATGRCRLL